MANNVIPILICIDVEPAEREVDLRAKADWNGFEEAVGLVETYRRRAEDRTGRRAHFSWFVRMDAQIERVYGSPAWVAARYGDHLALISSRGDEIGLHTHAWRWSERRERWASDLADQSWVEHCVRLSFDAYAEAFKNVCRSFRFGDRWMNDRTLALVESLGAEFDLTVEPGRGTEPAHLPKEIWKGPVPDYRRAPRSPYRPSAKDFRKPAAAAAARGSDEDDGRIERDIWMIPLTTVRIPVWPEAGALRRAWLRFRCGPSKYVPLSMAMQPSFFKHRANDILRAEASAYLCIVARTDQAASPVYVSNFKENMEFLLSHPSLERMSFATPPRFRDELVGDSSKASGASR